MAIRETPRGRVIDGRVVKPLGGVMRDTPDHRPLRQGRTRHEGFDVAQNGYKNPPAVFFTRDSLNLHLGDQYRQRNCFLILGGPSFGTLDHNQLNQRGILTMAVNNGAATYRPHLWCEVDNPENFLKSIWVDPGIMKFCPYDHAEKHIFDGEKWKVDRMKVGDCPNVVYYRRNESFDHKQWLWEDSLNWGCHKNHTGTCGHKGGRSVFLPAIRILWQLGVKNVFLLGCDFKMSQGEDQYHFPQSRTKGSAKNNNTTYKILNDRFDLLRPEFEKYDFHVYNCNKDSGLKSFPYVSYEDAITQTLKDFPKNEGTEGRYDRLAKEKKGEKTEKPQKLPPKKYKTLEEFVRSKID